MRAPAAAVLGLAIAACHPLPPPLPPASAAAPRPITGPPAASLEHYALAILAWSDGNLDQAWEELGVALLFDPTAAALHAAQGRLALDRGAPVEAARALTLAWSEAPGDLSIQVDRARAFAQAGQRDKAIAAYRLLLEQGRRDAAFSGLIRLLQGDGDLDGARQVMATWREAPITDPTWLRARAELCLELDLGLQAWEDFVALVEGWVPEPPALQGLLEANDRVQRNRATLEVLGRIARATPGDAHVLELLASLAVRLGDLERATPALEQIDRLQRGEDAFTRLCLAQAWLSAEAPAAALAALDTSEIPPGLQTQVAYTRASALLALGREAEALAVLDAQHPSASARMRVQARLFEEAGRLLDARDALRAVPLEDAGWYEYWDMASLEARTGGLERALALLTDAPEPSPDDALAEARLHALAGDLAGAVNVAAEVEARHPHDPAVPAARAGWLAEAGDERGALGALRAAQDRDLVSPDLASQHAALALAAGADEEARQVLQATLAVFRDDAVLQNDLAWFQVEHGEHGDEVLALAWRAVDQEPANAAFLDTLGWILFQRGEVAMALPELEHAARIDPANETITSHLRTVRQAASAGKTR